MYHTIEFTTDLTPDLEGSPRDRLERVQIRRGIRVSAQVKPYVIETVQGPVEVADLFFPDDTAIRSVPFACFRFVD
jgi:hypothetical protein